MKSLSDVRILDLTHVWYGPWCTMLLAAMAAELTRIEPPWGALDRIAEGARFAGDSYTFHHLNLNKKAITLNLKTDKGLEIFKKLVKLSDVVVQNFRPGTMERLGLGYDILESINPQIIYAALSGFGQYGPYKDRGSYAPIVESMSGHTRLTGDGVDPEGPPILMAQSYGDLGPGSLAAMSILAAIRYKDKTGVGQMIDVSQLDCMVSFNTGLTGYMLFGLKPWEINEKYPGMGGIRELFKTKDGWIMMRVGTPKAMDTLKKLFAVEEITEDVIAEKVKEMTRDDSLEFFLNNKIPVGPVYDLGDVVKDPHLRARNMFIELRHPIGGNMNLVNFPIKFSKTPGLIHSTAPLLGEHNEEILLLLNYSKEDIKELHRKGVINLRRS
jgi:crotonobetainyl-CoA:carnitine CoA-transferase CaiB-like acyl-CoA transferase